MEGDTVGDAVWGSIMEGGEGFGVQFVLEVEREETEHEVDIVGGEDDAVDIGEVL